jgi:hypothetical protein
MTYSMLRVGLSFPLVILVYPQDIWSREPLASPGCALSSNCLRRGEAHEPRYRRVMEQPIEQAMRLPEPIPVHPVDWMAWVSV